MMSPEEWATVISILQKLLPEYAVRDFTNLENDHCYIVEVLLHEGQTSFLDDGLALLAQVRGSARVLQTFVSRIAPYYYNYVWEMAANGADGNLRFAYPKRSQLFQREKQVAFLVERVLKSLGYQSLPPRTAATVVPDIETECLDTGEVALFHLLFSELFSIR
ncbi:hypothetical protein HYR99_11215 [Candidatus Poribacteria bacterium]|nr:hypothetical protein [Candidatus Poribacteria bacterium]